jgi:hypothetical protein
MKSKDYFEGFADGQRDMESQIDTHSPCRAKCIAIRKAKRMRFDCRDIAAVQ